VLRRVLQANPHLGNSLTRCVHCRIYFVTDPRNRGRRDIRCPYGCRQAHGKKNSTKRSVAYYQTPEGKIKKRIQNSKRTETGSSVKSIDCSADEPIRIDETTLHYLLTVTRLIEGRYVALYEVLRMVETFLRQHSMYRHIKAFYPIKNSRGDP